jgi:Uri superfamily endonuclease
MVQIKPGANGTYILILYRKKGEFVCVGALGNVFFKKGFYAYVGRALGINGFFNRIGRHVRSHKRLRWHVDYLRLPVREVWVSDVGKKYECGWAKVLDQAASNHVPKFGSTDCRCPSHLFYFKTRKTLQDALKKLCRDRSLKRVRAKMLLNLNDETRPLPDLFQLTQTNTHSDIKS